MTMHPERLDVTESYRDAQTRLRQIEQEIEKAKTFLECGATTEDDYRGTHEHIEELREERQRIKDYWADK